MTVDRPPEQGGDRPHGQGSWWSDWGKPVGGVVVLMIGGVLAAILIAILLVVIF